MGKDVESTQEEAPPEALPLPRSQIAFRRLARDFAILQTGLQGLEEDLLGIAEILGIPIERGPPMPRIQEPPRPSIPDMRSEPAKQGPD